MKPVRIVSFILVLVYVLLGQSLAADPIQKSMPVITSIAAAKSLPDGTLVSLSEQIVTAGTSELGDCFYIESSDRSSGIKVTGLNGSRGSRLAVMGLLATTIDGEKTITAAVASSLGTGSVEPLAMSSKALGGGDWKYNPATFAGQRGVFYGAGLNNIGLLVKITGKVTGFGEGFFYVDDGSEASDGSGSVGVRVKYGSLNEPQLGQYVSVTGISSMMKLENVYLGIIRPRMQSDIVVLQ